MQMNLGVPTPRAAHTMCAVDNYLLIFGGKDIEARKNDLHIFDTG
jgi:amphiphysin